MEMSWEFEKYWEVTISRLIKDMEGHYLLSAAHFIGMILEAQCLEKRLLAIRDLMAIEHHFHRQDDPAALCSLLIKLERCKKAPSSLRNIRTTALNLSYGGVFQDYVLALPEHFKNIAVREICSIIQKVCSGDELNRLEEHVILHLLSNL